MVVQTEHISKLNIVEVVSYFVSLKLLLENKVFRSFLPRLIVWI